MPAAGFGQLIRLDSLGGAPTLAKRGRCVLAAVRAINTTAADAYVQLFDAESPSDVVLGTTRPDWAVLTDFGAGDVSLGDGLPTMGLVFEKGIVAASTTTATGSAGATQHVRLVIV